MLDYAKDTLVQLNATCLAGKRIVAVDASACNVLLIEFDDGESVAIESHHGYNGLDYVTVYGKKI